LETVHIQFPVSDALDLDLYLRSPDGTTVELTTDNGGYSASYGTSSGGLTVDYCCFNMSSSSPITSGTPPFNSGPYLPEGDLDDFNNGQNADGTWRMIVSDDGCWFGVYAREFVLTFGDCTSSGYGQCSISLVLPVELLSFDGESQLGYNTIKWQTATEINNDHFVLEILDIGGDFKELAIIQGEGNSVQIVEYEYRHESPNTIEYYRLKQVDIDGQFEYSNVIAVRSQFVFDATLYPNPTNGDLYLNLTSYDDATLTIVYTNVLGVTSTEVIKTNNGTSTYQLYELKDLSAGFYSVQIMSDNSSTPIIQKVIKNQ